VPPPASRCPQPRANTTWNGEMTGDKTAKLNVGDYTLNFDKKDSSITMVDNRYKDSQKPAENTTKIWGDPHLSQHGKDTGTFNGPMTFNMRGDIKMTVGTAKSGNSPITYADNATITLDDKAFRVTGLNQNSRSPLKVEQIALGGKQLDYDTPDGYSLVQKCEGPGWIDPATDKEPTRADLAKH
jgi:hypothetical protein